MNRLLGVLLIGLLSISSLAHAESLEGTWTGMWTKNGDALPVTVTFKNTNGAWSGSFDSDTLQVAGIPFKDIRLSGSSAHWLLPDDSSSTAFDGALNGDHLTGSFKEADITGSFVLTRSKQPPQALSVCDVTFQNGAVTLAGSLIAPSGSGSHPAILFLHGSGPEGRWASRYLAEHFARAGIAALIFDKRGVGQSTGDWKTASFDDLASDAVAGVRFLKTQPGIDGHHIGIYGHSQGGTLAPLVAVKAGDLAFVIVSAAGGIDPAEMEEYSVGNSIGIATLPPTEAADAKAFVHAIVDVAYRGKSRSELDTLAAKFKTRSWYFDPPPADNSYWALSRSIARYDPASNWRQVKVPVLLLYGTKDERVPPQRDADAITSALKSGGNAQATLRMFPDADHTFALPTANNGWPKHVPDYADALVAWTKSVVR
jgi:pimeloyl-ACP methyl ester carboxylesterase